MNKQRYSNMFKAKISRLSPPQILALSFFSALLIGTGLLKLPISSTTSVSWVDAMFTATSAITVTGLTVVDIGRVYTTFGHVVMMCLMQLGGLGIMTFAVLFIIMLGKRVGLHERILIQEAFNQNSLGGLVKLVKIVFLLTITIEAIAFIILSARWIPEYGWTEGMFQSLFHTISAFNNSGFSLWSDNLSAYVGDPIVNLVITGLLIIGGIGFTVLIDVGVKKRFRTLAIHSKLMIVGTFILITFGFLLFLVLEYTNPDSLGPLTLSEKLWAAYFQAVTPRTAGFNTIDIASLTTPSILLITFLMFIGAGSASTGGGIKVTTFLVMILATISFLTGKNQIVVFNRTIKQQTIFKGLAIIMVSILFIFLAVFVLTITEKASFLTIVFEVISAFGTVGLSLNFTGELTLTGKFIIMAMMFIGRVGPLTLAFILAKQNKTPIRYPEEDVFTG